MIDWTDAAECKQAAKIQIHVYYTTRRIAEMGIAYDGLLFIKKEKITAGVLFILLLLRFGSPYLSKNLWGDYAFSYQTAIVLPMLMFVIWINQKSLGLLRINKLFLSFFALSCFLLCFYYWDTWLEVILLISLFLLYIFLLDQNLPFEKDNSLPKFSNLLFTILGLMPLSLFAIVPGISPHLQNLFSLDITQTIWIFTTRLWNAIFEIMLFYGILWLTLKKMEVGNIGIITMQVLLFWFAHFNLFPSKTFWVTMPILGLWFGYLSLRSRSLIPATITYFIYNVIAASLQLALPNSSG